MNKHSEQQKCPSENLTMFFYGELDETEQLRMERHLKDCVACREELAELTKTLGTLPKMELKVSRQEIMAFNERVNRRIRLRTNRFFRPVLGGTLAAATIAAILLVTIIPLTPEQKQPYPDVPLHLVSEFSRMPDTEMLLNLELLQNLDLLQELAETEAIG